MGKNAYIRQLARLFGGHQVLLGRGIDGGLATFQSRLFAEHIRGERTLEKYDLGPGKVTNIGTMAMANDFAWAQNAQTLKLANNHAWASVPPQPRTLTSPARHSRRRLPPQRWPALRRS